jgi:hypothetical protein
MLSIINYDLTFDISSSDENEGYPYMLTMYISMLQGPIKKRVYKLNTDFSLIEKRRKVEMVFPFAKQSTDIFLFNEISDFLSGNENFEEPLLYDEENGDDILLSNSDGVFSINQIHGSFNNKSYFTLNSGTQKNFAKRFSDLYKKLLEIHSNGSL